MTDKMSTTTTTTTVTTVTTRGSGKSSNDPVVLDSDDDLFETDDSFETDRSANNNNMDNPLLFQYPFASASVSLYKKDKNRILGDWFNDNLVQFLLDRIQFEKYPIKKDVCILNVFFLKRYMQGLGNTLEKKYNTKEDQAYDYVKKWLKKDIFGCKYILIPVNSTGSHWSLIIVCNPNKISLEGTNPNDPYFCMYHLDSIRKTHISKREFTESVYNFLKTHWQNTNDPAANFPSYDNKRHNKQVQKLPQQFNASDCGIYIVMYADYLFKHIIEEYAISKKIVTVTKEMFQGDGYEALFGTSNRTLFFNNNEQFKKNSTSYTTYRKKVLEIVNAKQELYKEWKKTNGYRRFDV